MNEADRKRALELAREAVRHDNQLTADGYGEHAMTLMMRGPVRIVADALLAVQEENERMRIQITSLERECDERLKTIYKAAHERDLYRCALIRIVESKGGEWRSIARTALTRARDGEGE